MRLPSAAVLLALGVANCTTPPIAPGVPRVVARVVVSPYQSHDECMRLAHGDRLDWRYRARTARFQHPYREGNAVLSPVVREHSTTDAGEFEAASRKTIA